MYFTSGSDLGAGSTMRVAPSQKKVPMPKRLEDLEEIDLVWFDLIWFNLFPLAVQGRWTYVPD